MPSSKLIKILNIFAGIAECCSGKNVLLSLFTRGWQYGFAVEKEDCIANITRMDMDLPTKIQSFVAQIVSNYCIYSCFGIPSDTMLNFSMVTREIEWNTHNLPLPTAIREHLHPTPTKTPNGRPKAKNGGECKGKEKVLELAFLCLWSAIVKNDLRQRTEKRTESS